MRALVLQPPPHVGDLLGPLVDEQHEQVHLGVVRLDRADDLLHHRGLAGLGRRHDEAALALPDRRDQVDDPRGHVRRVARVAPCVRRTSGNSGVRSSKRGRSRAGSGILAVHLVDPQQRRVLLVAQRRAAGALEVVALAQPELAGLLHRHVHVVARGRKPADAEEAVALVAEVEVALDLDRLAGVLLGRAARGLARAALAIAVAAAAATAAVAALVVVLAAGLGLRRPPPWPWRPSWPLRPPVASSASSGASGLSHRRSRRRAAAASTSHSAGGSSAAGALRAAAGRGGRRRRRRGLGAAPSGADRRRRRR